jgi:hypothetical protein
VPVRVRGASLISEMPELRWPHICKLQCPVIGDVIVADEYGFQQPRQRVSPPIPSKIDGAFLFINAHTDFLPAHPHNVGTEIRRDSSTNLIFRFQGALNDGDQVWNVHRAINAISV